MALSKIELGAIVALGTSIVTGAFVFGQLFSKVEVLESRLSQYEQQSLPAIKMEIDTKREELLASIREERVKAIEFLSKSGEIPVGSVFPYIGKESSIPGGYLLLNGQTISKSDFPELFSLISTLIPSAIDNGGSFVQLPDLRGKFLRGWGKKVDNSTTKVGDFQSSQVGGHIHSYSRITAFYGHNYSGADMGWASVPKSGEALRHSGEGGDGSNKYRSGVRAAIENTEPMSAKLETRPENFTVFYIVKAKASNK
ncbi:tail fiber protein [Thalassomonas viridans]|uniref:Tail fiber protein n=1 Tax=Thalassomonas viridans TaxID=137584 RepID=A0AAF0CBI9_9GAMM|nr:phage tail protein [Thalassomonas viridans]WDE07828.1 tail fiber protein [Thalassomonas viridans]